jgi:serine/threonine protein kinase
LTARRRFRFHKELASGGFGKVYLAEVTTEEGFTSLLSIKVLHSKWAAHTEIVQRARDEARLLGRLRHRNIVRVEDLTAIKGHCAIVMEYLEGVDFKTLVNHLVKNNERLSLRTAFEATGAVAEALWAAWEQRPLQGGEPLRLIHRDVKPSNIMLTVEGDIKLLDFGTARANFETREAHTQALAFGSQAYMPPERLMGEPDTPAGDVFSLGVTAYEIIAGGAFGKLHLREDRYEKSLDARLDSLELAGLDPELRARVKGTLRAMLAYEPQHRPTSSQVVDIMEILAEEARDAGPRRFARTWVGQAMKDLHHEPEGATLEGQSLAEDRPTADVPSPSKARSELASAPEVKPTPGGLSPVPLSAQPLQEARTFYPLDDDPVELPKAPRKPLAPPPPPVDRSAKGRPIVMPPMEALMRGPTELPVEDAETVLDPEAAMRAILDDSEMPTQFLGDASGLDIPNLGDEQATRIEEPGGRKAKAWRPPPPTTALPPPPSSNPRESGDAAASPEKSSAEQPEQSAQGVSERPVAQPLSPALPPSAVPETGLLGLTERHPNTPVDPEAPPPPPESASGGDAPTLDRQEFEEAEPPPAAPVAEPSKPQAPKKSSMVPILAVVAVAFVGTVVVGGGLGWWWLQKRNVEPVVVDPVVEPVGEPVGEPVVDPTVEPVVEPAAVEVDLSIPPADGMGHLRLLLPEGEELVITLTSGMGYKLEVSGQGQIDVADVPNGTLRTKVRAATGGSTARGTLDVEEAQICAWQLSSIDADWSSPGCEERSCWCSLGTSPH